MQLNLNQFNFAVVRVLKGTTKHGREVYGYQVVGRFLVEHTSYDLIALARTQEDADVIAASLNQSIRFNALRQLFGAGESGKIRQ